MTDTEKNNGDEKTEAEAKEKAPKVEAGAAVQVNSDPLAFDTLPNRITIARILAVPFVILFLQFQTLFFDVCAFVVFSLAAMTDFLDGYLARRTNLITVFGKLIDPLADKFLVVVTLIMLQHLERISPYVVMVLICRELMITSLRALASAEGVIIAAGKGGKWKAALQMVAIPFLILHVKVHDNIDLQLIGTVLIYISVGLSVWSGFTYTYEFFKKLRQRRRNT